jgi:hypothetical protein
MKQRIGVLLTALALALGLGVFTAPTAQAGAFCNTTGICGDVTNSSKSVTGILATNGWPADASTSSWQRVAPGYACTYKDCDGFYIPSGYFAFDGVTVFYAGWHKISDNQNAYLVVRRR